METLKRLRGTLATFRDSLFLAELTDIVITRCPKAQACFPPELRTGKPPHNVNGLGEFMRHSMDNESNKLVDFLTWYGVPLMYVYGRGTLATDFLVAVWMWMQRGRRVYSIDSDLKRILLTTSPSAFTWKELSFPFESFVLQLSSPLMTPRPKSGTDSCRETSTIIVTRVSSDDAYAIGKPDALEPVIMIMTIPDNADAYPEISESERRMRLRQVRQLKSDDRSGVQSILTFLNQRQEATREDADNRGTMQVFFIHGDAADQPVKTKISELIGKDQDSYYDNPDEADIFLDQVSTLVANFLIFLRTAHHVRVSEGVRHQWERVRTSKTPAAGDIITDAQLFNVVHSFVLTTEVREAMDAVIAHQKHATGYELRTHFRAGYWRRPPGQGSDPLAEKTVQVSGTIVRPDNRLEGTLPGGAKARLKH